MRLIQGFRQQKTAKQFTSRPAGIEISDTSTHVKLRKGQLENFKSVFARVLIDMAMTSDRLSFLQLRSTEIIRSALHPVGEKNL